ncbi:hypothetical protein MY04_3323 [Flammeovirga sp. MY04]|uniref:hypothetical protein n=1 Tax=Flammeovirga sp. MY04 TaxID=1191459 RepID=UPI000806447D|nr:hypothetical protein [Flammeovirga sp. MY04]ANQ50685.1 hypothetical protein MY04_3323 [Flammeovirga sp. MY04]
MKNFIIVISLFIYSMSCSTITSDEQELIPETSTEHSNLKVLPGGPGDELPNPDDPSECTDFNTAAIVENSNPCVSFTGTFSQGRYTLKRSK